MHNNSFIAILLGYSFCCFTASAAPPAPAEKGLAGEDGQVVQIETEKTNAKAAEAQESPSANTTTQLQKQIADLESEIKTLRGTLEKVGGSQKELEKLQGKVAILEGDNAAISTRVKTLEDDKTALTNRVKTLEANNASLQERMQEFSDKLANLGTDTPKQQLTAKPAFVHSAVRFHNHEGRALRMNVNGVWHTLKAGENDIWVPYGPVHIYRYTGAEPKLFWEWTPYKDGYVMEFDIGTPPAEK